MAWQSFTSFFMATYFFWIIRLFKAKKYLNFYRERTILLKKKGGNYELMAKFLFPLMKFILIFSYICTWLIILHRRWAGTPSGRWRDSGILRSRRSIRTLLQNLLRVIDVFFFINKTRRSPPPSIFKGEGGAGGYH